MGQGEEDWLEWMEWFKALDPQARQDYRVRWPEPAAWAGFYAMIEHGTL